MVYTAYLTQLKNLHKHPNANRLQLAEWLQEAGYQIQEYN